MIEVVHGYNRISTFSKDLDRRSWLGIAGGLPRVDGLRLPHLVRLHHYCLVLDAILLSWFQVSMVNWYRAKFMISVILGQRLYVGSEKKKMPTSKNSSTMSTKSLAQ